MKKCKTCKVDFDEPYVNCASCRKKRTDYMNSYYTPKIPKSYTRDCVECGETFTTGNVRNSHEFKYCDDCNYNTAYSRSEKGKATHKAWRLKNYSPVKPKEIECPTCKITFVRKGNRANYCNPQCRPKRVYKGISIARKEEMAIQRKEGKKCEWCGKHICFEYATDKELQFFKNKRFCSSACVTANRMSNPMNRLSAQYRNTIGYAIRTTTSFSRAGVQGSKMLERFSNLDFSPEEFTTHIESLLEEGMTWDNYGGVDGWHIDHIRPVSSFNFDSTDHPDFKKCWALENLQPLWAKDNMSKGTKWDGRTNA